MAAKPRDQVNGVLDSLGLLLLSSIGVQAIKTSEAKNEALPTKSGYEKEAILYLLCDTSSLTNRVLHILPATEGLKAKAWKELLQVQGKDISFIILDKDCLDELKDLVEKL